MTNTSDISNNDICKNISKESQEQLRDFREDVKSISIEVKADPSLKGDNPIPLSTIKKKEVVKEVTGEINVDETLKDNSNRKVKISFKGKNFLKSEISKKTADAPIVNDKEELKSNPKQLGGTEQTVEEIRSQIIEVEKTQVDNFTVDDYEMLAEFLIDTLDWGASSGLMLLAKDKTDSPYTIAIGKKERLKKQLTRILIKSNTKMNFGVLFAISLIMAYIKPIKEAFNNRKIIKKGEEELIRKKAEILRKERIKKADEAEVIRKKILANKQTEEVKLDGIVIEKPDVITDIKETKSEKKLPSNISDHVKGLEKKVNNNRVNTNDPLRETNSSGEVLMNNEDEVIQEENAKGDKVLTDDTLVEKKTGMIIRRRYRGNVK